MEIKEKHFWYGLLILILIVSFTINFRVVTSTPIIFGDEGYFASRGEWVLKNLEIPKYTNDIYSENKLFHTFDLDIPFMIFLVSSFSIGGELLVKILDPILTIITSLIVFLFARKFYSGKTGILSLFFFLILPCVITYTIFLYGDMILVLFMLSSLYFLLRSVKEDSKKYLVIAGIFGGFSILTKETGLLIILPYIITFLFHKKDWLKRFVMLFLILLAFATPLHGFHNFILLGNPGIFMIENYFPIEWHSSEIKILEGENLQLQQSGTYAGIFQYGVLNYIEFSYGLGVFVFIVIGISLLFYRKNKNDVLVLIWVIILFTIIFYRNGTEGKVESLSRWLLPLMPFFAIYGALATEKIYDFLKGYGENIGKIIGILFIFMIVIFGLFSANTKAASLEPIKKWSPAFINGCDWIRRNTPEDSKIVSIWVHHGMYQCKRDFHWVFLPNKDVIVTYSNDTSYDLLKENDMKYIYLQKFSIAFEKTAEVYPVEFVRYIENSDKFEKVYEYPENCMTSQENDCVVVYKIL